MQHIQIPFALLQSAQYFRLTLLDCVVYALLTDRLRLSAAHAAYCDEAGLFVRFRYAELAALCRVQNARIGLAVARLRAAGLLRLGAETSCRGMHLAPRYYPALFSPPQEAGYPDAPTAAGIADGALPCCTRSAFGWRSYPFFMLPLCLCASLSLRSAVLYGLLRSRAWRTDGDELCCTLPHRELAALLCCSPRSLARSLDELTQCSLIRRFRRGLGSGGILLRDIFPARGECAAHRPDAQRTSTMMRLDRRKPCGVSENRPASSRASAWAQH